jgi:hypothetical protein
MREKISDTIKVKILEKLISSDHYQLLIRKIDHILGLFMLA